jgi:hypothetical protein
MMEKIRGHIIFTLKIEQLNNLKMSSNKMPYKQTTKKEKELIVDKYLSGKKLNRRQSAIIGHMHTKIFGKKIK